MVSCETIDLQMDEIIRIGNLIIALLQPTAPG